MLSGVKFISRDDLPKARDEDDDDSVTNKKKLGSKRGNDGRRKKKSSHRSDTSDDDDDLVRIKKRSKRSKKWYSSDEHSSESSDTENENDSYDGRGGKKRRKGKKNKNGSGESQERESRSGEDIDIVRKEMGLDWMRKPADRTASVIVESQPEEPPAQEMPRVNPRELNPYLKNDGSGYPEEANEKATGRDSLLSSSLVGDGGASWRLKALKRAQEQAAREGRKLEEVVEERWGSLGQLAVSAASHTAAPSRAHLHAIRNRNRKRGVTTENENMSDRQNEKNLDLSDGRSYLKDVSVCNPKMRAPKVHDSLSWGTRKGQNSIIAAAASSLNKFVDDGGFMSNFLNHQNDNTGEVAGSYTEQEANPNLKVETAQVSTPVKEQLSANQLAAKALQLRMKGRHEEAEKLMEEAANAKAKQAAGETSSRVHTYFGRASRHAIQDVSARKKEDDADRNLAQTIMRNKKYSVSGQADDEYDYELAPSKKSRKKGGGDSHKASERNNNAQRFLTQQERCIFCFENPNRPKHLVLSIANFTYLMLPQRQPVVPGHCCILPLQHESATRTVDNNVWEEIRNFKKCLIMMFAQQEKELVFLETVVGLAKQRCHCLIECIPLPQEIAKEAPLYFKKAIDEAEDEWSQHNAKKLIDTSEKGLRGSIPKDFPYFHVEFGLKKGFVHVIDDEKQFNSSLGLNVIRGMLRLPEEDMYRHRRHESVETQKQAVANFLRDWEPFDWTKQLD